MRKHPFDQIRDLIRDETDKVPARVRNLHGTLADTPDTAVILRNHRYILLDIPASTIPSFFATIDEYTFERAGKQELVAEAGEVSFTGESGRAYLVLTTARIRSAMMVPFTLEAPGYDIAVYMNGVLMNSGRGELIHRRNMHAGDHIMGFIFFGGSGPISISAPEEVTLGPQEYVPPAPVWIGDPEVVYLNPQSGQFVVNLMWGNSPDAVAWQVYRSRPDDMGSPLASINNGDGTVTLTIEGEHEVALGEEVYLTEHFLGYVVAVSANGTNTDITVSVIDEDVDPGTDFTTMRYYRPTGTFNSLARLTYAGEGSIEFQDTAVARGDFFLYRVTAFGFLDENSESDYSATLPVYVVDRTAPGPVTDISGAITGDILTLTLTTPDDADFYGVHVYGPFLTPPSSYADADQIATHYAEPGRKTQLAFYAGNSPGYYLLVTFDAAGNQQDVADAAVFYYEGPQVIEGTNNAAIELLIDGAQSTDTEVHLIFHVYPPGASVEAWLNTQPVSLTLEDEGVNYDEYSYILQRDDASDQRLIVVASGPGLRPATVTYVLDRDQSPGVSGVFVPDNVANPIIRAIMDDDANYLAVVESPFAIPGDIVWVAARGIDANADQDGTVDMQFTVPPLAFGEVREYWIAASKDKINWVVVWKGLLRYGTVPREPTIRIEVEDISNLAQTITVTATNPTGGPVRLEWAFGIDSYGDNSEEDTGEVVVEFPPIERSPLAGDRVLRFRATALDTNLSEEQIYIIDWDFLPEVVSANLRPYYDANNNIIGWTVYGVVDDDTKSIRLLNDGNPSAYVLPAQTTYNTDSNKSFAIDIEQGLGKQGTLRVQPYAETNGQGTLGKPTRIDLIRPPQTEVSFRELSLTQTSVTLTPTPLTAKVRYMVYLEGERPTTNFPETWTATDQVGVQSFIVTHAIDEVSVLEYYSYVDGVAPESPHFLRFDPNSEPEIELSASEGEANTLVIDVNLDDSDIASYAVWSRPNSWPTESGLNNDDSPLNDDFLRAQGPRPPGGSPQIKHFAATGTWYVVAVGYDYNGQAGRRATKEVTIAGTPGNGGLLNLRVTLTDMGPAPDPGEPQGYYHRVHWDIDDLIDANPTEYEVLVYEAKPNMPTYELIPGAVDADVLSKRSNSLVFPASGGKGMYQVWNYRVELYRLGVLISTYSVSRGGQFEWRIL